MLASDKDSSTLSPKQQSYRLCYLWYWPCFSSPTQAEPFILEDGLWHRSRYPGPPSRRAGRCSFRSVHRALDYMAAQEGPPRASCLRLHGNFYFSGYCNSEETAETTVVARLPSSVQVMCRFVAMTAPTCSALELRSSFAFLSKTDSSMTFLVALSASCWPTAQGSTFV